MSLFNNLMSKIFGHAPSAGQASGGTPASGTVASAGAGTPQMGSAAAGTVSGQSAAPAQTVDVAAILDGLAAKNSEKLDWKHSIVDLMKLVGMDSSLTARKELAKELNYTGDTSDSASMNTWLHKQVLKKLSENGGKVPQELLS